MQGCTNIEGRGGGVGGGKCLEVFFSKCDDIYILHSIIHTAYSHSGRGDVYIYIYLYTYIYIYILYHHIYYIYINIYK